MSTTFDLSDTGATDIVHVDNGVAKPYASSGSDTWLCSSVTIDANGGVDGTIHSSHTTPAGFDAGDRIIFPTGTPPTIVVS